MSLSAAVPPRLELAALVKQRDELALEHEAAVGKLEAEGPDRAIRNRRECTRLYDELAAVQKRIDEHLERGRGK
jgi:hypothetical protein